MKAFHEVRSYDSDFMVWHSSYENISFLAHWHKEIELIYIRSGSCRLHITDHTFTAHAGDLAVCESGAIHYSDSYDIDNSLDFIIFDPNIFGSIFHNPNFVHPLITKEQLERYGLSERLSKLIETVSSELKQKQPYYQEVIISSLQTFWFLLKRYHPRTKEDAVPDGRRARMLADMQKLLDYIDEHYADGISLDYAANCMNFSNSYFSKTFKKLMGTNFVTYLNMVRIEHAAQALRETESKITDIALNCGFNNIRTFNRTFKEITGCTPSEYILLADPDTYKRTYYNRRSMAQEFVENDSLTVVKNFQSTQ